MSSLKKAGNLLAQFLGLNGTQRQRLDTRLPKPDKDGFSEVGKVLLRWENSDDKTRKEVSRTWVSLLYNQFTGAKRLSIDPQFQDMAQAHIFYQRMCVSWVNDVDYVALYDGSFVNIETLDVLLGFNAMTGEALWTNYMKEDIESQRAMINLMKNNLEATKTVVGKKAVELANILEETLDNSEKNAIKFCKEYFGENYEV